MTTPQCQSPRQSVDAIFSSKGGELSRRHGQQGWRSVYCRGRSSNWWSWRWSWSLIKAAWKCFNVFFLFHRLWLPKGVSVSMAKEWIDRRRVSIRPWTSFVDQRKFSKPRNFGEMCQRVVKNVEIYNSNYTFIFLGLILYCIISSPMLLIALAVFFGAFYIIHLKSLESKLVILGKELTVPHQMSLAGAVSLPVFWLAGAGAAVFWVLGATLFVIGSHAAFRELEGSDMEELLMEPV
ncbi:hypothetical protein L3Q82_013375 [Scortum barcoo]|uniref:Uncharacterized protein n=1 Tax=Scortum barcoo TaxID=214431 RepID=A0ACB8W0I4_9TELE|nr:hypothetical protein L3Q82_013375 [Scortum barcoo]